MKDRSCLAKNIKDHFDAVHKQFTNVNTAAVSTQACSVASVQGIHRYMIDRKDEKDWASRVGTKSKEMYMMYMIS